MKLYVGRDTGFRGSIAPASLKADDAAGFLGVFLRFRGSIAPASLKVVPRPARGAPRLWVPGLYCPGLIEGISTTTPMAKFTSGSGALLPRPH